MEHELLAQSNMVMMIFKFFLQSKEYTFFVRRLKNVAMTRTTHPSVDFTAAQRPYNEAEVNQRGADIPQFQRLTISLGSDDFLQQRPYNWSSLQI